MRSLPSPDVNDIHVGRQDDHRFKFAVSVCTLS